MEGVVWGGLPEKSRSLNMCRWSEYVTIVILLASLCVGLTWTNLLVLRVVSAFFFLLSSPLLYYWAVSLTCSECLKLRTIYALSARKLLADWGRRCVLPGLLASWQHHQNEGSLKFLRTLFVQVADISCVSGAPKGKKVGKLLITQSSFCTCCISAPTFPYLGNYCLLRAFCVWDPFIAESTKSE